jgi:glycosyltransferase involved in cell wall biosynthesis
MRVVAFEKHIVVEIPSYNNSLWYERNLDSVFSQNYSNYHVLYIDDCSSDGTADLVERYVKERGLESRVTLVRNKTRQGAMANHYYAIQWCADTDIVIQLDGDDWLAHSAVFSFINTIYQQKNIWITYGQYVHWPSGIPGYKGPVKPEVIRESLWRQPGVMITPGYLRTFYAWLAKTDKA